MRLSEIFDPLALTDMIDLGMVKSQRHPTLPFMILNYTPKAVYSKTWNDVTLACRGLIIKETSLDPEVVARPFPKFFNWDQAEAGKLPVGMAVVAPKMDGSLGVLYQTPSGFAMATRGSFTSPQAVRATQMFERFAPIDFFEPLPDKTYLFEIIYPENRIVVDYGSDERLVLLEVIDNETGLSDLAEFDSCNWMDKADRKTVHLGDKDGDAMHKLLDECPEDEEGLVFYFPQHNKRLKMKKAEYMRLHRIVTGVGTKTIWHTLSQRGNFDELLDRVPDEFYDWVKKTVADFNMQYDQMHFALHAQYVNVRAGLPVDFTRKDFAQYVKKHYPETMGLLFQILDGKDLHDSIWAKLKPVYEKPFAQISEDAN